jgi:hypothetical protein
MSEKQTKIKRRLPVAQIIINVMQDGSMNVGGFPSGLDDAITILDNARRIITYHFIDAAKNGKLNDRNVIEKSSIITPKNNIIKMQ